MQEGGCEGSMRNEMKLAGVPSMAKQAGESRPTQWGWVERSVWTNRMLEDTFGTLGSSASKKPTVPYSSPREVNHRPESRMREICMSGSEGGAAQYNAPFLPLSGLDQLWDGLPASIKTQHTLFLVCHILNDVNHCSHVRLNRE